MDRDQIIATLVLMGWEPMGLGRYMGVGIRSPLQGRLVYYSVGIRSVLNVELSGWIEIGTSRWAQIHTEHLERFLDIITNGRRCYL